MVRIHSPFSTRLPADFSTFITIPIFIIKYQALVEKLIEVKSLVILMTFWRSDERAYPATTSNSNEF